MDENPIREGPFIIPPVATKEQFSKITGIPIGVIRGWIDRREIVVIKQGKRVLIDVLDFYQNAKRREADR